MKEKEEIEKCTKVLYLSLLFLFLSLFQRRNKRKCRDAKVNHANQRIRCDNDNERKVHLCV